MASETGSKPSSSAADSYIGSLISLTSKSDIRYEGILCKINTEESSIGLNNVRSFGTEGRRKDGPQVMPSDMVYGYILFRGSDIKDLQVKSSQPVQPTQPINSDPAIIQSHYSRPPTVSSNLPPPAAASDPPPGPSIYTPQLGHPGSTFQGGLPLYQPGGNVGQWAPSPPPPNSNSAMPMYWPGGYYPPNALPQMHQQTLPRPPQLGMPPSSQQQPMQYPSFNASSLSTGPPPSSSQQQQQQQPMQYPSFNASSLSTGPSPSSSQQPPPPPMQYPSFNASSLSTGPSPSSSQQQQPPMQYPSFNASSLSTGLPPSSSQQQQPMQYPSFNASSLSTGPPPSSSAPNLPEYQSLLLPTSTSSLTSPSNSLMSSTLPSLPTMMQNKPPNSVALTPPVSSFQSPQTAVTTDVDVTNSLITPNVISGARYPFHGTSQPITSVGSAPLVPTESPTPSLVTPKQLLQSVPATIVSSQSPQPVQNDVEVVQISPVSSSASSVPVPVPAESQPPILPLPTQTKMVPKSNGAAYHNRQNYNYRGRERGRGSGVSRPVMKFTEEFDFSAMNEKFNKDEVWGTLGKSNRSGSKEKDENATDEDEPEEENDSNLPKADVKPVYSKDDFFDSLSSNALDRQSNHGRTRFSEQMKLDTETFGEFSRYRGGGRGGRVPYRGGGRFRGGGYNGRGGGYGYSGRGRGGRNQNATNY